jgi:TPR repeat protein
VRTPIVIALVVFLTFISLAAPVAAGPLEDAYAAYNRGDYATALRLFRPLAEQGNAEAQFRLGEIYLEGIGVPKDAAEATQWFQRIPPLAQKGDARAQTMLGSAYSHGWGVPQNYPEAMKWYRKAADQGDAQAQVLLGQIYDYGEDIGNFGVPQDYAEAAKWYRRAADQGDWYGQASLGQAYESGKGVPQDYVQAFMWLNLAAANGGVLEPRDRVAKKMTLAQIAEALKLAREWKPKKN